MGKRIIIVNTFFSPLGGAEVIAYNTYKILKKHGYEVYFWACNKEPFFDKNYPYVNDFTVYDSCLFNYFSWYYNNKAKKDCQKFINKVNPDIIHLHNFISYLSPSILDCCKDIPTIATLHDTSIVCPAVTLQKNQQSFCNNISCKNGKYYKCLINNCAKGGFEVNFRKTLRAYLVNKKLKYINKFITPSNSLKTLILNSNIGIKQDQIVTINNFLTEKQLKIVPNYKNEGYFLFVGRLSREKGIHYLLEAMKDLSKDIKLKIAGSGTEENKLRQYAKENLLYNVEFLGFKNRDEMNELYQNCIATILPSNCFDNFPTTNLESFANGKPVIASNIGGISEQVEHNITGQLFEPANVKQLKECILKYWYAPDLVKEHGINAYQKAIIHYNEKRYYNELSDIYANIVENC